MTSEEYYQKVQEFHQRVEQNLSILVETGNSEYLENVVNMSNNDYMAEIIREIGELESVIRGGPAYVESLTSLAGIIAEWSIILSTTGISE
ncbi:MAG: hypothetical protein OXU23_03780 [Candidatus Poribacteria bacterium]|nr:hypothetical protein [Candidatus Poribacteria bacterium]